MIPVTDGLLGRMVRAIVDEVDPEQVILFGSPARGDERESSDVDFVVVEAEPFGPDRSRRRELVRIHHARRGFGSPPTCSSTPPTSRLLAGLPQPRPGAGVARREGAS